MERVIPRAKESTEQLGYGKVKQHLNSKQFFREAYRLFASIQDIDGLSSKGGCRGRDSIACSRLFPKVRQRFNCNGLFPKVKNSHG